MNALPRMPGVSRDRATPVLDIETATHEWGEKILSLTDNAPAPSIFGRKGFYGALMDWAMRDEHFKTQLFRFVDVLPTLGTATEIARHLKEYLGEDQNNLSPTLRAGMRAATGASWLFSNTVKAQIMDMARQFMLGNEPEEILNTLRQLHDQGIAFTVDVLGEAVVSETEADQYAQRYLELIDLLGKEAPQWPPLSRGNSRQADVSPTLNISVKISALYSQFHPTDPETAIVAISTRLRPLLRRASQLGAFVNFDMESYGLKALTLQLFKTIFA
ncbi:MAG TPA: proline dehydrogenase family protein, partial [Clostridia bacterium]|nr:proline dehydrogenase family protein [Clostridia bacterium]